MGCIVVHPREPRFIVFLNYKVLFSSMAASLTASERGGELVCIHGWADQIRDAADVRYENGGLSIRAVADGGWIDLPAGQCARLTIVRNPFARSASCFAHWCRRSPDELAQRSERMLSDVQAAIVRALDSEPVPPGVDVRGTPQEALLWRNAAQLRALSFEGFLAAVETMFDRRDHVARPVESGVDPHVAPQAWLLSRFDGYWPTYVARAETMDSCWPHLRSAMRIEVPLGQKNVTGAGATYRDYYDATTRRTIERLYHEDLNAFDYAF